MMRARELRIPRIAISNSRIEIVHKATRQVQVKDNDFINDSLGIQLSSMKEKIFGFTYVLHYFGSG